MDHDVDGRTRLPTCWAAVTMDYSEGIDQDQFDALGDAMADAFMEAISGMSLDDIDPDSEEGQALLAAIMADAAHPALGVRVLRSTPSRVEKTP